MVGPAVKRAAVAHLRARMGLSERRAKAVRDYMVSEGINPGIVDVIGMGERQPVATNDTEEGRQLNRRVDILVGTKQPTR